MVNLSEKTKIFIQSSLIISLVSLLGTCGFYFLQIGNFIGNFLVFTVFQFILFSFIASVSKAYINRDLREKELEKLESLSAILQCAYCSKQNLIVFSPNDTERIEFFCEHCKRKNLITMQFTVSQVFEPLEIPKVTGIPSTGN